MYSGAKLGRSFLAAALLSALLTGCDGGDKPDAIWGEGGTQVPDGPRPMVYPRGITYSAAADEFYVIDRQARIQRLDGQGRFKSEWQMADFATGKPTGLSVGPDGLLYVADTHYQRVVVFKSDGTEVRRFGKAGTGPGEFIFPTDIAFDTAGNVYVSEYGDHDRIQVFTPSGEYLREMGSFGTGEGQLCRPQSMVIDSDTLYVTDACNHRIAVFTTSGKFLRNIGKPGSGPGEFRFPYGLDQDDKGHLLVCEFGNNRVQLIDKATGASLRTWGRGGREPGELAYPWAAVLDKRGRAIVVDSGSNRLQVFRP